MRVGSRHYRTIWFDDNAQAVHIIDQRWLPHEFRIVALRTLPDFATAIRDMWVRGAPLVGATTAWGLAMAAAEDASDEHLQQAGQMLLRTRPTAVNLRWAVEQMLDVLLATAPQHRASTARRKAEEICDADVAINEAIGDHGLALIRDIAARKPAGEPVRILTHCNAGWLATVDWGTATAPIYKAHDAGLPVHVWVDETRPRNQGAHLTAWELAGHGVPHRLVVDNAGGHLMQQGLVDMVIVGTDRTTACGDVANKIGTYLKALAAHDNDVPFYVALPSPTIDWTLCNGRDIPIEERDEEEVRKVWGRLDNGHVVQVEICPEATRAANPAFDVTPARYVSGLITERGVCAASREGLWQLFPEQAQREEG